MDVTPGPTAASTWTVVVVACPLPSTLALFNVLFVLKGGLYHDDDGERNNIVLFFFFLLWGEGRLSFLSLSLSEDNLNIDFVQKVRASPLPSIHLEDASGTIQRTGIPFQQSQLPVLISS